LDAWIAFPGFLPFVAGRAWRTPMADALDRDDLGSGAIALWAFLD
jgi:hypothetical protein